VASAGTSPYLAISAALCALRGFRHGGQTALVDALFDAATVDAPAAVAERLKHGQSLPGFGHVLYPQGDPRAKALIELVRFHMPDAPALVLADSLVNPAGQSMNVAPNIDFGLVLLARSLALPKDAPLLIFAAGRTAGWIGQIIEEYQRKQLIRPRARYTGPRPISG
jgi:citrate synthase